MAQEPEVMVENTAQTTTSLSFKWGEVKNKSGFLEATGSYTINPGTIYIATDERSMYVDTATKRIRIGDFVEYNTLNELKADYKNWNTSSLAYVKDGNILAKYDTGKDKDGNVIGWKQINDTKELSDAIKSLQAVVGSASSGLVKSVNDLSSTVSGLDTDLQAASKTISDQGTAITNLKAVVGDSKSGLVKGVADINTSINTINGIVGTSADKGLRGSVATNATNIELLDTAIDEIKNTIGSNDSTGLRKAIKANADDIDAIEAAIGENGLGGRMNTAEGDIDNLQATVGSSSSGLVKAVADLQSTAQSAGEAIDEINEAIGENGLGGRMGTAEEDIDDLQTLVGTSNTDGLRGSVASLQTTVGNANSGLVKTVGEHTTAIGTLDQEVKDINAAIGADNNSGLRAAIKTNADDIDKLEGVVGNSGSGLVKNVADLQATVGSSTSGLVKDVADLGSALDGLSDEVEDLAGTVSDHGDGISDILTAVEDMTDLIGITFKEDGSVEIDFTKEGTLANGLLQINEDIEDLQSTVGDADSGLVKDVATNTSAIEGINNVIEDIQSDIGDNGLAGRVSQNEEDIDDLQAAIGDADSGLAKAVADLQTTVGDTNSGLVKTVAEHTSALTAIDDIQDDINDINAAIGSSESEGLRKQIKDNKDAIDDISDALGLGNVSGGTSLSGRVDALEDIIGDTNDGLVKDVAANTAAIESLEDYVNDSLAAADAMKFISVLNTQTSGYLSIPDGSSDNKISCGDTYKIGIASTIKNGLVKDVTSDLKVYVGDLLIAAADQGEEDATYTGKWFHISSGYEDDYNAYFDASDSASGATVNLKGGAGEDRGQVSLTSSNSSIAIGMDASGNDNAPKTCAISFDLVWGTF